MNLVLWKKLNFNNLQNSSNSAYSAIAELKLVEILVNYNNAIVMSALKYLKGSKKIIKDFKLLVEKRVKLTHNKLIQQKN